MALGPLKGSGKQLREANVEMQNCILHFDSEF